jgi:hypothetical protein
VDSAIDRLLNNRDRGTAEAADCFVLLAALLLDHREVEHANTGAARSDAVAVTPAIPRINASCSIVRCKARAHPSPGRARSVAQV